MAEKSSIVPWQGRGAVQASQVRKVDGLQRVQMGQVHIESRGFGPPGFGDAVDAGMGAVEALEEEDVEMRET